MGIWGTKYRKATVGLFSLAFLVAYSVSAITTAMPRAAQELQGFPLYGLAFAVTMATSVVAMAFAAPWIDHSGPGVPLMAGIAVDCLGLLVAAAAPTMEVLVAGRAIQGLGAGLEGVALYVVIARVFPAALRAKMFAALAAAWVLPSIVGPAISGAVTDQFGWRWVFVSVPFLAVFAVALVRSGTRGMNMTAPTRATVSRIRLHRWGVPQLRIPQLRLAPVWRRPGWALASAVAVLVLGNAAQRTQPWWPVELSVAVVVLILAVPRLLPQGTWRSRRGMPSLILMRALIGTAFTLGDVYLPLLMIQQRGLPAWLAGLSLTVGGITWFTGSWFAGRGVVAPHGRLMLGALGILLGVVICALVVLPTTPVWIAWLGWAFAGLGMGMAYPTQSVLVLEQSPPADQGSNASALQLNETLTTAAVLGAVGAVFAALLVNPEAGFAVAFGVAALLALAAGLAARRAG
ncbi:MFS transporter [Paenarthrobacter sp. PH39-S1]|uniref:MFS transporter n=1 Tax=Paenarthrobacter sp. PH39-S1 TaxID=3046204 RepID=UPI0024B984C9|nr:MFS transporter [Paenarthrobacter sp. PH39-S1]MDJ0356196.1 MFS transporter [Paenarthrobacter sp. PH39-S1]